MILARRQILRLASCGAGLAAAVSITWAQNYPSRPIHLVVPFPPGGAFDALGRLWAERMKPLLGTIVIENIGGAGSSLGGAAVARASPDGYTLLMGGTLLHVTERLLKRRPLYDPLKDLDPIYSIAINYLGVAIHPSVPARTLQEFITYAKANPGTLSYGHAGAGSTNHLSGELFKTLTGTRDIEQVPYRGAGPAIADLVSGQIPMAMVAVTGQVLELHRSGKLRIVAVTSPSRIRAATELVTAAEAGLPGLTLSASLGVFAPARTSKAIIEQIAQATRLVLADRTYQQMLIDQAFEPTLDSSPEKFRKSLEADIATWTPVAEAVGLKID